MIAIDTEVEAADAMTITARESDIMRTTMTIPDNADAIDQGSSDHHFQSICIKNSGLLVGIFTFAGSIPHSAFNHSTFLT